MKRIALAVLIGLWLGAIAIQLWGFGPAAALVIIVPIALFFGVLICPWGPE